MPHFVNEVHVTRRHEGVEVRWEGEYGKTQTLTFSNLESAMEYVTQMAPTFVYLDGVQVEQVLKKVDDSNTISYEVPQYIHNAVKLYYDDTGKKIQSIKMMRQLCRGIGIGSGLKACKDYVDKYIVE